MVLSVTAPCVCAPDPGHKTRRVSFAARLRSSFSFAVCGKTSTEPCSGRTGTALTAAEERRAAYLNIYFKETGEGAGPKPGPGSKPPQKKQVKINFMTKLE